MVTAEKKVIGLRKSIQQFNVGKAGITTMEELEKMADE